MTNSLPEGWQILWGAACDAAPYGLPFLAAITFAAWVTSLDKDDDQ